MMELLAMPLLLFDTVTLWGVAVSVPFVQHLERGGEGRGEKKTV